MSFSQIVALVIAVLALLWIGSGIFSSTEVVPVEAPVAVQDEIFDVRIRTSSAEKFTRDILLTGRTKPSRMVGMKAEIGGRVIEILKEEGAVVKAGEVLARLELQDREARVKEAQSLVAQREIQFQAAKTLESKGFNSRVALAEAEANVENARAVLENARSNFGKTDITAPFDGILNLQSVEIGDYLSAGDDLFTIVQIDPLEIEAFVAERDIALIRPGKPVRATFLDGDKTLEGIINFSAAAADPQTRTFRVLASASNPDNGLKAGLTLKLSVPAEEVLAHKISPSNLTLNDAGQIGVKIVDTDDIVKFVPVKILADLPDHMRVGGLPETAKIITVGQEFVKPGQKVKPVEADGKGLL